MLLLTARGTPILYYGDELGMTDVAIPADRTRDGFARREGGPSRDPNRTPMPWSSGPGAGFSRFGAREPWLPLAPDWKQRNVERQRVDGDSMLALYRRLLDLRRVRAPLRQGTLRVLPAGQPDCLLFERSLGADRLLIALNFSAE